MSNNQNHRLPLTSAQTGIWFAQQLEPLNPIYRTAEYIDIHSQVDLALLEFRVLVRPAAVGLAGRLAGISHTFLRHTGHVPGPVADQLRRLAW
jgi:hypothetical protein